MEENNSIKHPKPKKISKELEYLLSHQNEVVDKLGEEEQSSAMERKEDAGNQVVTLDCQAWKNYIENDMISFDTWKRVIETQNNQNISRENN